MANVVNLQNAVIIGTLEQAQALLTPKRGANIIQAQGARIVLTDKPPTPEEAREFLEQA